MSVQHPAENDAPENTPPSVRRKWRVVDDNGKPLGVWVERFDRNPAYTEAWALDCIKRYHPGREVQVQTVTTSDWTCFIPPATWGHWCREQEPVTLPADQPRCPDCGALDLSRARVIPPERP